MTEDILQEIDRKLHYLVRLQVEEKLDADATNKEKIKTLQKFGFSNSEMADIVGTSEPSVRGTLSKLRKEGEIDD